MIRQAFDEGALHRRIFRTDRAQPQACAVGQLFLALQTGRVGVDRHMREMPAVVTIGDKALRIDHHPGIQSDHALVIGQQGVDIHLRQPGQGAGHLRHA